ncbi:hypothetical protein NB640_06285 [Oxalobacter vibrioformis]|uniref:Uncharacterized protein n=1 Tax=Oxalobacter vibrioformis TaxID=933080 RepID=A0A9E9P4L8_9BURK|nr:hypothetical protein [Oxalobacter vibrioformis]WAW11233.1 hypothetical protein NB640_06285 [Oxalobacter vibrioformis]
MALSNSQQHAIQILHKVLETQPNVVSHTSQRTSGDDAARFCISFIEAMSEWLSQQKS